MSASTLVALDLVAITVMVFGLYFPRHRRRDLVAAFLGVNIGVMAVSNALASTSVSAGLGLGLFGVLSIIRLRSDELAQEEVAYYFTALALGLLAGLPVSPTWLSPALMGMLLAALYLGDNPRLFQRYRSQTMVLDRAFTDERALVGHLEQLLGGRVHSVKVKKVDLVHEITNVEVRYETPSLTTAAEMASARPEGLVR